MTAHDADWYGAIERDAGRYAVVFLHLGRAFEPRREQLDSIGGDILRVEEFLLETAPVSNGSLIILSDVQICAASRRWTLGQLRAKVVDAIDTHDHKFILVSTIARAAFPTVVGSDLLADAKHAFIDLELDAQSPTISMLPGWDGSKNTKESFLASCVSELSAETVVNLGELIWDLGLSPNECIDAMTTLDKESLRGAGLMQISDDVAKWVVATDWKAFRAAVAAASSRYLITADWLAQSFVDLWLIERQLRNSMRDALMDKHGAAWRSACSTTLMAAEVVERARRDVQPRADKIEDLRDPLEWLTTSELLDLRETRELGGLGLEPYMWTKLRGDLLPIRNRAAHMRVVSERDALTVATWRKITMSKLGRS